MTNRRLKKSAIPFIYAAIFIGALALIYLIQSVTSMATFKKAEDEPDTPYVSKTIFEDELPVVGDTEVVIARPYTDNEIKIIRSFYDYKGNADEQQNSLIYHENTYLQNSGIAYGGKDAFDVVSILDGTVIDVKEDNLLGNIVQIRHNNDLISVYQSLSDVKVKKDDIVKQGQVIAKSGTSNISKELNSHLHFELIIKGQIVNPELYFDKKISEL